MRGRAWLRTSPYVALPFDSDRVRPELVGLLCFIPSRAARRGEDFFTLRTEVRRVVLQACGASSWRRAKLRPLTLGGRAPDHRNGPKWRIPKQQFNYTFSVPDLGQFLKRETVGIRSI